MGSDPLGRGSRRRWLAAGALGGVLAVVTAGCAARSRLAVPQGIPQPSPEAAARIASALAPCRDVRALSAEVAVSGRLGGQRVRGRLLIGVERAGRLRLEGLAPFGEPVFVLVADGGPATLLLPRDRRVLDGADPAEVLDALAGIRIAGDDLLALLCGCVAAGEASGASLVNSLDAAKVGAHARAFAARRAGSPRVVLGEISAGGAPLLVGYAAFAPDARPREIHLERPGRAAEVALRLRLSQPEYDPQLPGDAFVVRLPPGTQPLTLDELRDSSPLAAR